MGYFNFLLDSRTHLLGHEPANNCTDPPVFT